MSKLRIANFSESLVVNLNNVVLCFRSNDNFLVTLPGSNLLAGTIPSAYGDLQGVRDLDLCKS